MDKAVMLTREDEQAY